MNGDGTPDYGSCIAKKRNAQSYWFVTDVVGSMTQSKGTSQGAFFDTEDMKPLVNNEAFRKALDFFKESTQVRPAGRINLDVGDTRPLFASGRCALNLDWGDVGTHRHRPEADPRSSTSRAPPCCRARRKCSNWDTGKLDACTADTCPYAVDGVNHAPFAAFGGWGGGINAEADPKVKDAAYAFFSYHDRSRRSRMSDVTIGETGFNPYRTSQFDYSDTLEEGRHERGRRRRAISAPSRTAWTART